MADFGKLWFEMGVRDNVTNGLNVALKAMKQYHGEIDKVNEAIERWATLGKDFSQKNLIGQDSIKNVLDFQKSIYEVRKEMSKLFELRRNTKTAGLDTKGVDDAIKALYTQYRRLQNLAVNGDTDISKGALQAFRQQLAMTLVQVRDFSKVQIAENKAAEDAVRKNIKANKELASTLDKLKSKQFEMSNVRSTLMNAMGSADPSVDLTQARNIMSRLWSKQMQVYRLMRNGQAIPDNFFGADYKELIRQAKEMSRVIGTETTNAHRAAEAAAKANADASRDLVSAYDQINQKGLGTSRILNQLGNQLMSIASLYGAERLLKSVIQVGGEFETQHIALKSILGDVQQANTMFEQMKQLAVFSPFNFRELVSYSKQIAAFGVPYEEMYDTTKRLADMSAGLGVDMSRLILAYGQVRSAAVLRGQELRQFTEAGIPMVQALADEFTKLNGRVVTTGEVFGLISKRAVPFEMVKKVLWDMTNEGGRFYDMQFILADTLAGKWSNLQDAWEIMLSEFAKGESVSGKVLKGMVQMLTVLIENLNKIGPMIAGLGFAYLTYDLSKALNNLGDRGLNMRIAQAQKLNALKIRERYIQGEINQLEYQSAIKRNSDISLWTQQLAMSGRLNALQLRSLDYSSMKNRRMLMELVTIGSIDKATAKAIMSGNLLSITWKSVGASIKTAIGPLGWILLAMDAIVSVGMTWMQKQEEIEERSKNFAENAAQRYNVLKNLRESINAQNVNSDSDYTNAIDQIKDQLKEYDASYASIMKEVDALDTLEEKYMALKVELSEVTRIYKVASENRASFEDADRKTDGWFDEGLEDNLEDWKNAANETNKALTGISEGGVKKLQEALAKLAQQGKIAKDAVFDELGKQKPLSQALGQLFGDNIEKENIVKNYEAVWRELDVRTQDSFNSYLQAVQKRRSILFEDLMPDLRIQAENAKKQLMLEFGLTEEDFKNPNEENRRKIENMYKLILQNYKNYGAEFQRTLDNTVIPLIFHFQPIVDMGGNGEKPLKGAAARAWDIIKKPDVGTGAAQPSGFTKKDIEDAFGPTGNNYVGAAKYLNEAVAESKKEYEKTKAFFDKGIATQKEVAEKKAEFDAKQAELNQIGPVEDKKKGSGGGKGSQKDSMLEGWKERLKELENFYNVYKRYAEYLSKEDAIAKAKDSGVFKGTNMPSNISDFLQVLRDFRDQVSKNPMNTDQRRSFFSDLMGKIDTKEFEQEFKEAYERMMKNIKAEISHQNENWNLYKEILGKTGNKDFAMGAFNDGYVWDSQSTAMADDLRQRMAENLKKEGPIRIDFDADEDTAKQYFRDNFRNADALFEIWKEIVKQIKGNYVNALKTGADAYQSTMTAADKVLKIQQEIDDLTRNNANIIGNGSADDHVKEAIKAQIEAKKRELEQAKRDAFRESSDYLNFYNAILTLTIPEAEKIGVAIKKNLNDELKRGKLSARQYLTEIKKINEQMQKLYDKKSGLGAFLSGGLQGYFDNMKEIGDNRQQRGLNDMKAAEDSFNKAVQAYNKASSIGDTKGMEAADAQMQASENAMSGASAMQASGEAMSGAAGNAAMAVAIIDKIVHGINGIVQGMKGTFDEIREMYDALGHDTNSEGWQDANTFFSSFSSASASATKGWDSLKNGDVGGVVEGVVGSFTGWITGFAKGHDAKRERLIQLAQEQINAINRMKVSLERSLERSITGIYKLRGDNKVSESFANDIREYQELQNFNKELSSFGIKAKSIFSEDTINAMKAAQESRTYYDQNYALLLKQRDELQAQYNAEEDKKKSDSEKLADFQAEIESLQDQITHFAEDMAKALYDIDFKSWASELGDALVDAWAAGESGAEAYKKKVSEILKNLGVKMITERFIATALEPIMNEFMKQYEKDDGVLTTQGMAILGKMYEKGQELEFMTNDFMNGLNDIAKQNGADLKDTDTSSSSLGNGIKGVTENTADLLASYINAIRADVSVNRITLAQILMHVQNQSEMPAIARSQLEELRRIADSTSRNADAAEMIYELLHKLTPDGIRLNVKY